MDKKNLVKRVLEKVADKKYVDDTLIKPIQDLVKSLKKQKTEDSIKDSIMQFFKDRKIDTEKQAYVLETLIRTYDIQLTSPTHKKVLKELSKKNTFVDIIIV